MTRLGSGQPLLYHYTDSADVDSTELSYAELRALVQVSTQRLLHVGTGDAWSPGPHT